MPTVEEEIIARLDEAVDQLAGPTSYETLRVCGPYPPRHVSAVALTRALNYYEELSGETGSGGHAYVTALAPPWEPSNPSVVLTPDGATYGPYADGAAAGGSLRYHGLDGQPFAAVRSLAFNMRYLDDEMKLLDPGAAPYARVFLQDVNGNTHDAAHTPGSQNYSGLGPGPFQEFVPTAGAWRYDDDAGTGGVPLAALQAAHPDDVITKLTITLGFTDGTNLGGLLRWWEINGTTHSFGGE